MFGVIRIHILQLFVHALEDRKLFVLLLCQKSLVTFDVLLMFLLLFIQLLLDLFNLLFEFFKLFALLFDIEPLLYQALLFGYLGGIVHLGVLID